MKIVEARKGFICTKCSKRQYTGMLKYNIDGKELCGTCGYIKSLFNASLIWINQNFVRRLRNGEQQA